MEKNKTFGLKQKLRRAFTITELVIVIAVIAILAAILIPTFSSVINNSKKSHDEQYVKSMNEALAAYTVENGAPPTDYEELMLAFAEAGLCDASNPFLLGTTLKQDNVYVIWYPNTNSVALIDTSNNDYVVSFTAEKGLGNGVYVSNNLGNGSGSIGFVLCTTGTNDGKYIAQVYKDFYIASGGDIAKFTKDFGETYADVTDKVSNKTWGVNIAAAIKNQTQGYTYSESIADLITKQSEAGISIHLNLSAVSSTSKEEEKTAAVQTVRSSLATLASLANDSSTAKKLAGKTITLASSETENVNTALSGVEVDMKDVRLTAIRTTHRDILRQEDASSFSVNFSGVTIKNYSITDAFVASGSFWQAETDNSVKGGSHNFNYGLFGTLFAKQGETVTISNLHFEDVNLNLSGATETVGGAEVNTVTDSAGLVAGYTQGNVVFENITIDGLQANGERGKLEGYDGLGAIVGRCYGAYGKDDYGGYTAKIKNCSVSNLIIKAGRKGGGFVGIFNRGCNVVIENSSLNNVEVIGERLDGSADVSVGLLFGYCNVEKWSLTVNKVELENVSISCQYHKDKEMYTQNVELYYATEGGTAPLGYVQAGGWKLTVKIEGEGLSINGNKLKNGDYVKGDTIPLAA